MVTNKEHLEDLWDHPTLRFWIEWLKPEVLDDAVRSIIVERFPWDPVRVGVEKFYKSGKWGEAIWYG